MDLTVRVYVFGPADALPPAGMMSMRTGKTYRGAPYVTPHLEGRDVQRIYARFDKACIAHLYTGEATHAFGQFSAAPFFLWKPHPNVLRLGRNTLRLEVSGAKLEEIRFDADDYLVGEVYPIGVREVHVFKPGALAPESGTILLDARDGPRWERHAKAVSVLDQAIN